MCVSERQLNVCNDLGWDAASVLVSSVDMFKFSHCALNFSEAQSVQDFADRNKYTRGKKFSVKIDYN